MPTPYSECLNLGYVLHKLSPQVNYIKQSGNMHYRYKTINVADGSVIYFKTLAAVKLWIKQKGQ